MRILKSNLLVGAGLCAALLAATSCSKSEHNRVEKAVPETSAAQPRIDPDASTAPLAPPTAVDVRQAIARIYGDNLRPEPVSAPRYLIGDFNGDDSADLAVEVRPLRNSLSKLNDGVANWIVEDPRRIFVPDPNKGKVQRLPAKRPREQVRVGEPLLAIVHGYGPQGWREAIAQQSYLLRNAGGTELALKKKEEVTARDASTQLLFGDLIERGHDGKRDLLFWTGGYYAWFRR